MAHRIIHLFAGLGMLALCLMATSPVARADLTIFPEVGGAPTGVNYVNFDELPLGSAGGIANNTSNSADPTGSIQVSFAPDGQVVTGSATDVYAAPYLSGNNGAAFGNPGTGADTTPYVTTGVGSATLTFSSPQMYFGLLWGSVDTYNTLTFYDGSTKVGQLTGSDVTSSPVGDQGVSGTYYVNIDSTLAFNKVVASSSQYAFEFDNVAYNATQVVPEPSSFVVAIVGAVGMIGYKRLRRKGSAA